MDALLHAIVFAAAVVILAAIPLTGAVLFFSMIYAFLEGFLEPFFRK